MRVVHWHTCKIVDLDYTDKFHGIIRMASTVDGIRVDVILEDNKTPDEIVISTLINVGYNEDDCNEYALSVLDNEEHCCEIWKKLIEGDDG